jgi:hypothetical protein
MILYSGCSFRELFQLNLVAFATNNGPRILAVNDGIHNHRSKVLYMPVLTVEKEILKMIEQ